MQGISGTEMHLSDGDQKKTVREKPGRNTERFAEGNVNAHSDTDPKDQRTLSNRLASAQQEQESDSPTLASKQPTAAAREHGNEPSRGAVVDEEIMNEEADYLKRKGKA